MNNTDYISPFSNRYGSESMRYVFSNQFKHSTWRKLWVLLAQVEKDLGLNITTEQIVEMTDNINNIDFERVAAIEQQTQHDVMAHILAFGEQCPKAKPIIHLGATSCYVTDNTDVIQQKIALTIVKQKLLEVIDGLLTFADKYADTPTMAYTHYQVAQPTTVGKRASMWLQDLMMDLEQLNFQLEHLKPLGCKGATGTAASFMELFEQDQQKVLDLEYKIVQNLGFKEAYPISGQTYTRKQDFNVMQVLSDIAQSASKFAIDVRLLSNLGEIQEPHSSTQVGSSAMPHKSNPIKCEKITSLARFVVCTTQNTANTASVQWLERTLDDSANRRICISEAFLATDEILSTYKKVVTGLDVDEKTIQKHLENELPSLIMESILMAGVTHGGDRQELHELLRKYTHNMLPLSYPLVYLKSAVENEPKFNLTHDEIESLFQLRNLTGLAEQQTKNYINYVKMKVKNEQ